MVSTNYDVNARLLLATTAEQDGNFDAAMKILTDAYRAARGDDVAHVQVHDRLARLHAQIAPRLAIV